MSDNYFKDVSEVEKYAIDSLLEYIHAPFQPGEQETIKDEMDSNTTKHRWAENARKAISQLKQ